VQATLMRSTIHVVARGDYWPIALTLREGRQAWWRRATKSQADMDEAAEAARAALREGPKTRKELEALVGKERFHGLGHWLELVRVPPSGTWERRRADLYGLAEEWIGPPHADPSRLVRRYLQGFGPATLNEIASFAGLNAGEVDLSGVPLRRFKAEDGAELLDLPRAPLPPADTPAPPRLLPTWDATLLVHARRALIIREEDRERIFSTKTPHSFPTFTIDGTVEGTWRHVDGRIELEPWRDVDTQEVELQAAALAQYLGEQ
jgi:hypothetical protein